MRTSITLLLSSSCLFGAAMPLRAAPETLTGEVISLSCYMNDKSKIGAAGYVCALATVKWEGNPAGLLTADGKIYQIEGALAANNNERLWPLLSHTVTITGNVSESGTITTIIADEAKDIAPPK